MARLEVNLPVLFVEVCGLRRQSVLRQFPGFWRWHPDSGWICCSLVGFGELWGQADKQMCSGFRHPPGSFHLPWNPTCACVFPGLSLQFCWVRFCFVLFCSVCWDKFRRLASDAQKSSCLHIPRAGMTDARHHTQLLPGLVLCVCVCGTLSSN